MHKEEIKRQESERYFDLAEEYLKHAKYDLEGNIYCGAIVLFS